MKRLAVVTGGTRGIGAAISIVLKNAGYLVAAGWGRDAKNAEDFSSKNQIKTYQWDVANYEECKRAIAEIKQDFGRNIDILINNAGVIKDAMLHKMQIEDFYKVINTNLGSCFNMCHLVIPEMREQEFGRIVNISSVNAQEGQLGQTNYSAAKAGILGFTKALAKESAKKNITVNAIAPGYINTDMLQSMPKNLLEGIEAKVPVGRLGTPEDIARAVLFLVSDEAGFITGSTLSVNGGQYMI